MERKLSTVVLIDEYPLFRKGMADVLTASGDFQVLGQTADEATALSLVALGPDLVVMNLQQEGFDTLRFLQEVKTRQPQTRVVMMLTSPDQASLLMQAIRQDANGYLLRTIPAPEFVEQLYRACHGGMAASDKITSALADRLRGEQAPTDSDRNFNKLTKREYNVLCCIASSYTNKDISERLGISDGTVKVHVKHVLKKLNFRSRVEVAAWASEHGYKISENGTLPEMDPEGLMR